MFENLDKTRVPTGFLLDFAVDLVDLSYYDGTELTDGNYVNSLLLDDILRSIKSATVLTLPPTRGGISDDALSLTWPWIASHSVDISVAAYRYNYIKANALEDGLITYDSANNKVSDAYKNGVWQNPYGETEAFAFSPSSNVSKTRNITFNFSSSRVFKNLNISKLYFDAGDGTGYRDVTSLPAVEVVYASNGKKELKMKLLTSDGLTLEAHSLMNIAEPALPARILSSTETSNAPTPNSMELQATWDGITVAAQVTFYMRNGILRKPFIVAEGFDPWELNEIIGNTTDEQNIKLGTTTHKNLQIQSTIKTM